MRIEQAGDGKARLQHDAADPIKQKNAVGRIITELTGKAPPDGIADPSPAEPFAFQGMQVRFGALPLKNVGAWSIFDRRVSLCRCPHGRGRDAFMRGVTGKPIGPSFPPRTILGCCRRSPFVRIQTWVG